MEQALSTEQTTMVSQKLGPKSIRAALVDLSGTVHIGKNPAVPGAAEAVDRLRKHMPVRFLTNTSKQTVEQIADDLRSIGLEIVDLNSIQSSVSATVDFLVKHRLRPYLIVEDDLRPKFGGVPTGEPFNCVVVALSKTHLNYESLNNAFRIIMSAEDKSMALIAVHRAKYFKDSDKELSLGPGGFVTCLEEATGVSAITIGKPNEQFFHSAVDKFDTDPQNVVMIGDSVSDDVNAAIKAGIGHGILVRTGKYREGDADLLVAGTNVVDSIVDAVEQILSME